MTALIRAELRKLATTRTTWLLAAGALALIAGAVTASAAAASFTGVSPARACLTMAGLAQTFALLAGSLAVTTEYRHKTITPALLISPRRLPLLAAKLVTLTVTGAAFGLLTFGTAAAIALPVLAGRHIASGLSQWQLTGILAGGSAATALFAALGVGIGTVVRNQVAAVITVLALLYVAEPLLGFLPGAGRVVQRYGLAGIDSAATGTTGYPAGAHLLGHYAGGAVLAAYAAAAMVAGAVLLRRRDVTA
jgi:ABC-2 type transport system permease protein